MQCSDLVLHVQYAQYVPYTIQVLVSVERVEEIVGDNNLKQYGGKSASDELKCEKVL